MAEVITQTDQFKYDFEFSNASGSVATRTFSISSRNIQSGLSAAKELQQFFAGQGSLSVASIVPNEFIQPTGWRDNDPNEPPWKTDKVYLTAIRTMEQSFDPAGGGESASGRNIVLSGAEDPQSSDAYIYYDNLVQNMPPTVKWFNGEYWDTANVTYVPQAGEEDKPAFYFNKTDVMRGKQATVYVQSNNVSPADLKAFTIA